MLVRSTEMEFRNGRRYRVNPATGLTEPFEITLKQGKKLPARFVPADTDKVVKSHSAPGGQAPGASAPLKRNQIMKELRDAGVTFKATDGTEHLQKLLDKTKAKIAPAASLAPSKENQTGDDPGQAGGNSGTPSNKEVL